MKRRDAALKIGDGGRHLGVALVFDDAMTAGGPDLDAARACRARGSERREHRLKIVGGLGHRYAPAFL